MDQISVCSSGTSTKSEPGGNILNSQRITIFPYFISAETREYVLMLVKSKRQRKKKYTCNKLNVLMWMHLYKINMLTHSAR